MDWTELTPGCAEFLSKAAKSVAIETSVKTVSNHTQQAENIHYLKTPFWTILSKADTQLATYLSCSYTKQTVWL